MRQALIAILLALPSYAASITASGGFWNSTSSWVGGSIPTSADDVTIPTAITQTIPPQYTASAKTVTVAGTGSLVNNGTLQYYGNSTATNLTGGPNSSFIHVSSSSSFTFGMPGSCTPSTCVWAFNGTPYAPVTWTTSGTAFAGTISTKTSSGDTGNFTATYTNFSNIGNSSNYAMQLSLHSSGATLSIHNSTCTNCGAISLWERANGTIFSFDNFRFTSASLAYAYSSINLVMANAYSSGTFEIKNSYIEGQVNLNCGSFINPGLVLQGNFLYAGYANVNDGAYPCNLPAGQWDTNVLWSNNPTSSVASNLPAGYLRNSYMLSSVQDTCVNENYHTATLSNESTTIDGWILEGDCGKERPSSFGGKTFELGSTPGTHAFTVQMTHTINLPRTAGLGGSAGDGTIGVADPMFWNPVSGGCDGVTTFCGVATIDNDTSYTSGSAGALYNTEVNTTQSALISSAKNNIIWSAANGQSSKLYLSGHTTATGSLQNVGCNWKYNDNGTGIQYGTTSGTYSEYNPNPPGGSTIGSCSSDPSGNPAFFDSTRNFIKWCQSITPSDTTWTQCLAHFKSINAIDNGYNPANLIAWVQAGFTPTNLTTATASSTGAQVGAVAAASTSPVMLYTDLDSGPKTGGVNNNGVFVRIFGKRFGTSSGTVLLGGAAVTLISWADTQIVFQPGSAPSSGKSIITVTLPTGEVAPCVQSGNCDFTIRSGNIYCISNSGSNSNNGKFTSETGGTGCWQGLDYSLGYVLAGDTLYFGANATDTFQSVANDLLCESLSRADIWIAPGYTNMFGQPCGHSGTPGNPVTISAYPGNSATIGGAGSGSELHYAAEGIEAGTTVCCWTIANLHFVGSEYYYNNGYLIATQNKYFRGVNLNLELPLAPLSYEGLLNPTLTTATDSEGIVNRWYGNYLHNLGVGGTPGDTSGENSKHAAMIYQGADGNEQEFGWNIIDGAPASGIGGENRCYHNHSSPGTGIGNPIFGVHVHDNTFKNCSGNTFDMAVDPSKGSGVEFYNNIISGTGSCTNWVGYQSGYAFFGLITAEDGADFNWLPESGKLKLYNNTWYNINSNSCLAGGLKSGMFTGPDGVSWEANITAPPAPVQICAGPSCSATQSGTLPVPSSMGGGTCNTSGYCLAGSANQVNYVTPATIFVTASYPASTYFGVTQGGSTITVGGVAATVVSWSNSIIEATAPTTLSPGNVSVVVTIGGTPITIGTFTVYASGYVTISQPAYPNINVYGVNYFPGGVVFQASTGSTLGSDTQSIIDDGAGNLTQQGTNVGTINYQTGAYSFTLLSTPGGSQTIGYLSTWTFRVDVRNNIFSQNGEPVFFNYGGGTQIYQLNNTLWYNAAGTGANMQPTWPLKVTNPIGSNSDPLFTSPSTGDFTLQSSSPAIASGVNAGVLRDFAGKIRLNTDAGALAFNGTTCLISPTSLGPWTVGQTPGSTLTESNCVTSTFSLSGSWPTGVSGCSSGSGPTCTLSGAASGAGTFTPSVAFDTATNPYTIVVNAAPSITTSSPLPSGTVGVPYSQSLAASGGTSPLTWSVSSGTVPIGTSLSSGGVLSGTPSTTSGSPFTFTALVTDANLITNSKSFTVTINGSIAPTIAPLRGTGTGK